MISHSKIENLVMRNKVSCNSSDFFIIKINPYLRVPLLHNLNIY